MSTERLFETWAADAEAVVARDLPWERLAGRRVLVTGAGGFLGGALVRALLTLGRLGKLAEPVRVVAMVRDADRARERLADVAGDPDLEFLEWDLNRIAVPEIGPCAYVLHAASQASPRLFGRDPVGTLLPNAVGTAALLEAFRAAPERLGFLFISTSEVYGSVAGEASLGEADFGTLDPATPRACYAESKRLGETLCVAAHQQYQVPTVIARPFHTYGPGLQPDDGRVFADFAFDVVNGRNIVMTGDGSARRAFCYVSDAVAGFFTVLFEGESGRPYNVANPDGELSVMDLADLLVGLYPERGLRIERRALPTASTYLASPFSRLVPDVSRLAALGWRAEVGPARGFRRMIEAHTP